MVGVIQHNIKSGTNQLHGTAFIFEEPRVDARNFFVDNQAQVHSTSSETVRRADHQKQMFSGDYRQSIPAGGPVLGNGASAAQRGDCSSQLPGTVI